MKINRIRRVGRNGQIELETDSGEIIKLPEEVVLRAGLGVGDDLGDRDLRRLEQAELEWRARDAALRLLAVRPRSEAELLDRLRRKGLPTEVVEACVKQLAASGLVDDQRFAESFARDRIRLRPSGGRRVRHELRARGVDPEVAAEAMRAAAEEEGVTELELALRASQRWKPRAGEERERARRRLAGFLARRGFGAEVVREVLRSRGF